MNLETVRLDIADFIATLSQLNIALNGERPSEGIGGVESVRRDIAYAVAEVLRLLREVAGRGEQATAGHRQLEGNGDRTANCMNVLSGDRESTEERQLGAALHDAVRVGRSTARVSTPPCGNWPWPRISFKNQRSSA